MDEQARLQIVIDALNMAKGELDGVQGDLKGVSKETKNTGFTFMELKAKFDMAQQAAAALKAVYDKVIGSTIEYAGQVRQLSRTIGAAPEDASKLIQVADDVGLEFGQLQGALEIAIRKGVRPTIEGMGELADQYNNIQDPIAKTKFLVDNFGRSGADLIELMRLGSAGMKEFGKEAEITGMVLDAATIQATREYELAVDSLGDTLNGLVQQVGEEVVPILTTAAETVSLLVNWNAKIDQALQENKRNVTDSSETYEEYAERLEKAAEAAGYSVDEQGRMIKKTSVYMNGAVTEMEDYIDVSYQMTEAQWDSVKAASALTDEQDHYMGLLGGSAQVIADHTALTEYDTKALEARKEALSLLAQEMSQPLLSATTKYYDSTNDLAAQEKELQDELDELLKTQGKYVTVTTKATTTQAEYDQAMYRSQDAASNLGEAQKALADAQASGATDTRDLQVAVTNAQVAYERASGSVDSYREALGGTKSYLVDNGTEIDVLRGKLNELWLKKLAVIESYREERRQIAMNVTMQALEAQGIQDPVLVATLMESLGLADKGYAQLVKDQTDLTILYKEGKISLEDYVWWTNYHATTEEDRAKAVRESQAAIGEEAQSLYGLRTAADTIPESKTVRVDAQTTDARAQLGEVAGLMGTLDTYQQRGGVKLDVLARLWYEGGTNLGDRRWGGEVEGMAQGGWITRDGLYRVAEQNTPEFIVSEAMQRGDQPTPWGYLGKGGNSPMSLSVPISIRVEGGSVPASFPAELKKHAREAAAIIADEIQKRQRG